MATSKDNHMKKMEAILTCSICLETFNSPRTLPCSHTFCEDCLKNQVKLIFKDGKEGHECPLCRQFSGKNETIDLKILKEFVELYQGAASGGNTCELCQENAAEMKCTGCRINRICAKCLPTHIKVRIPIPNFQGHNIIHCDEFSDFTVDETVYCEKHTKEIKDLYCSRCKLLVCSKCSNTIHKLHETITVEDALDQIVPLVQENLDKIEYDKLQLEKEMNYFEQEIRRLNTLHKNIEESYSTKSDNKISNLEKEKQRKITDCKENESTYLKKLEEKRLEDISKLEQDFNKQIADLKRKFETDKMKITEKHDVDKKKITEKCKELTLNLQTKYDKTIQDRKSSRENNLEQLKANSYSCIERIQSNLEKITMEYKRKVAVFELAQATLDNAKSSSLMQALESDLQNKVETEVIKEYKDTMVEVEIPCESNEGDSLMYVKVTKMVVNVSDARSIQCSVKDVMSKATNKIELIQFDDRSEAERICIVENCFWIPQYDCIKIYSLAGKLQKKIELNCMGFESLHKSGLQQVRSTDVFLACENGLFVLDINGQLQYKLVDSHFCDVTTNGIAVVAATPLLSESQIVTLYMFSHNGQKWELTTKKDINIKPISKLVHKIELKDLRMKKQFFSADDLTAEKHCYSNLVDVKVTIHDCDNVDYVYVKKDWPGKLCGIDKEHHLIVISGDTVQRFREGNSFKQIYKFAGIKDIQDMVVLEDKIYILWERGYRDRRLTMFIQ